MLLTETILTKPILEETQREKLPDGVLCRVTYNICNIGERNANKRVYEKAVWDKVLENVELKEKLKNRALYGHAEHPEQTQSNLEKTSHIIHKMWIDEKEGKVYQTFDIVDTPCGRIVHVLLEAGSLVGCSTRAEGDLEEAEDGTYQRVIPESYKYVTTDFTADPSTFGVVPQDVKRNIVSAVGKEYHNESADKSEREFARLLLEHMKCKKALIGKCQKCGRCEALGKSKNMKVVKDLVTNGILEVGTKIKYGDKDATVEKIEEFRVSITIGDTELTHINLEGDLRADISTDGVITVSPFEKPPATIPLKVEPPIDISKELTADQSGKKPEAYKEVEGKPEFLTIGKEEELPEGKTSESVDKRIDPGDTIEGKGDTYTVIAVGREYIFVRDSHGEETIIKRSEVEEAKIDENIKKKKDGYHVYSKKDKHLEKFKHMKKESIGELRYTIKKNPEKGWDVWDSQRDEKVETWETEGHAKGIADGMNEKQLVVTRGVEDRNEAERVAVETGGEVVADEEDPEKYMVVKHFPSKDVEENKLLEEFYIFMDEREFPGWNEGVNLFAEHKKLDVNKLTEQFVELFPEGDIITENWKDLPKGWTRKSLKSFAKSLLGKVGKSGKGFVTACMKKMKGKVGNPAAFCAGLKDEVMGTVKWRGKESVESKLREILGVKVDTNTSIIESVENVSYVTVGKTIGRPCILVKFSKDRETLQGIVVTSDEEAIDKGREIASVLGVEFKVPAKTESIKISEIPKLMEEVQGELVDLRKVLGEGYLREIEDKSISSTGKKLQEQIEKIEKEDIPEVDLESIKNTGKRLEKGIYVPGYGLLDDKSYFKIEKKDDGYWIYAENHNIIDSVIEIFQLEKQWAQKPVKEIPSKESISSISKEITDLKVQEASIRAERDKAIELLEELNKGNKSLESKMLVSRFKKILESRDSEVSALITKLEEKAKVILELKESKTKLREELGRVKINLVMDIRKLEETVKTDETKYFDELKQLEDKHTEEVNQLDEKHNKVTEQLKAESNKKITEGIEKTKKEITNEFVKRFVMLRLSESGLKVDENSRALLENCKSLDDVDDTLDEIVDTSRRNALHSKLLENIMIVKPIADPEQKEAEHAVGVALEGMSGVKVKGNK